MTQHPDYEVLIIGGSYAGLSAAMTLGRSKRKVLIIDGGRPCNRQTPHAHNLIGHDGDRPADIAARAREQVLQYPTVRLLQGSVTGAAGKDGAFTVHTQDGTAYLAKKLILATGVRDILPAIDGFADCWGISVLHCPYCHGYEVRDRPLGVIGNGDMGFEYARLIAHWASGLTLFTNGPAAFTPEQLAKLEARQIAIVEQEIIAMQHEAGYLRHLQLSDGTLYPLTAVFARSAVEQPLGFLAALGCEVHTEGMFSGLIRTDDFAKTSVPGVLAAGDCCTPMRSLSNAMAGGNKAGAFINHELIAEAF